MPALLKGIQPHRQKSRKSIPPLLVMSELAFISAVKSGDVRTARRLVEQGDTDVNMMMEITWEEFYQHSPDYVAGVMGIVIVPALLVATAFGWADVVELLIEKKAHINDRMSQSGATALMLALEYSLFRVADTLLRGGADANVVNRRGQTPLGCCCCATHSHFIRTLLRYGANIQGRVRGGRSPLHVACQSEDLQSPSTLLEHGADVDALDDGARSPIFLPAINPDIMRMLIANGAQINLRDRSGWTPLHTHAERGDLVRCEALLSNNANIEAQTNYGETPLHFAVSRNDQDIVRILLAHQRSRHGHDGVASLLLKPAHEWYDMNVLHDVRTARMARFLLEQCRGEDEILLPACHQLMSAKDNYGRSPLDYARETYSNTEGGDYLESFTELALATAAAGDSVAVILNERLDDFQRAVATESLDLVRTCCLDLPDAVLYAMLGYLSASDVMKR